MITTDNITCLQTQPIDEPSGWKITFRSGNAGLHHQLYVNGSLADWTDTTKQRDFRLDPQDAPAEVLIAAVPAAFRHVDYSAELPASHQSSPWVYRAAVIRSLDHARGERLALLGDHAGGDIEETPLTECAAWPGGLPRWAFGEDRFGRGSFGHDGTLAPGLGIGAFGAGAFGFDTYACILAAALGEEGKHQLLLRTTTTDGQTSDSDITNFDAAPPPSPPGGINVSNYDPDTNTLTVNIE